MVVRAMVRVLLGWLLGWLLGLARVLASVGVMRMDGLGGGSTAWIRWGMTGVGDDGAGGDGRGWRDVVVVTRT